MYNSDELNKIIEEKKVQIEEEFMKGIDRSEKEERSPGKKFRKNLIKTAAAVALVSGITAAGCYVSPAFGDIVKDIPLLNIFHKLVQGERNEKIAYQHGHGADMFVSYKNENCEFNIIHGMRDSKKLVLTYEFIEDGLLFGKERGSSMFAFKNLILRDDNGNSWINERYTIADNSEMGSGMIKLNSKDFRFDSKLNEGREYHDLNFNDIDGNIHITGDVYDENKKVMSIKDFKIPMDDMEKSEGYKFILNKEIEMKDARVRIKDIIVDATEMSVKIQWDLKKEESLESQIGGFNILLEDDIGNRYSTYTGNGTVLKFSKRNFKEKNWRENPRNKGLMEYEIEKSMDSPYFEDIKYLKVLKLEKLDRYTERMIIDIKNKEIAYSDTERIKLKDIKIKDDELIIDLESDDYLEDMNNRKVKIGNEKTGIYAEFEKVNKSEAESGIRRIVCKYNLELQLESIESLEFQYVRLHSDPENVYDDEIILPIEDKEPLQFIEGGAINGQ